MVLPTAIGELVTSDSDGICLAADVCNIVEAQCAGILGVMERDQEWCAMRLIGGNVTGVGDICIVNHAELNALDDLERTIADIRTICIPRGIS